MFGVLLLIGVPVAYALAAAALATFAVSGYPQHRAGPADLRRYRLGFADRHSAFHFAGEIMMRGGISERLISLASSLVGRMRGGLGQVSILSSLFFGGVSGSAIADVSAVGGTMIPQMVKRGYDRDFAVNVSITAALVALLVPPSHNLILFSGRGRWWPVHCRPVRRRHRAGVVDDAGTDDYRLCGRASSWLRRGSLPGLARAVLLRLVAALLAWAWSA